VCQSPGSSLDVPAGQQASCMYKIKPGNTAACNYVQWNEIRICDKKRKQHISCFMTTTLQVLDYCPVISMWGECQPEWC
jgi:hypothetical protein